MLKSTLARLRQARASEFEQEGASEAGFTLIELMVVLLIIAILLAIAIPTFLGVTGSANDRASQSNLTNALTESKALYQNNQSYNLASIPVATLQASAPEFAWQQGTACTVALGKNCISEYPVDVNSAGDGSGILLAGLSKTGTCWYVMTLEATPQAAFVPADAAPPYQAVSAAAGVNGETLNGAALTTAGTFYSQQPNGAAAPNTCNATNPVTAGPWNWGSNFAGAPIK